MELSAFPMQTAGYKAVVDLVVIIDATVTLSLVKFPWRTGEPAPACGSSCMAMVDPASVIP